MKRLIAITWLMIFSTNTFASSQEIKTLDGGSCWYQEVADGVKVSSFNSGVSVKIDDEYLSSLNNLDLPVNFNEKFNSQLHCSTHGVSLVMNVNEDSKKYCLWFNIEKDGLVTHSVGMAQYDSHCDGYKPGVLHISLSKEVNFIDLKDELLSNKNIVSVERISDYLLSATLTNEVWGNEDAVKDSLQKVKGIKSIEKSHFVHPIGEWGELSGLKRE